MRTSATVDDRTFVMIAGRAGAAATAVIALLILVVVLALIPLVRALFVGAGVAAADAGTPPTAEIAKSMDQRVKQIVGRSLFFEPPPPAAPEPEAEVPDGPAPPPSRYGGPSLIAMINDTAFFSDGSRLRVVDHGDSDSSALSILSLDPPWSARVRWSGAEFTVPLFTRDALLFPRPAAVEPQPATPQAPSQPQEPAPAASDASTPPIPTPEKP